MKITSDTSSLQRMDFRCRSNFVQPSSHLGAGFKRVR